MRTYIEDDNSPLGWDSWEHFAREHENIGDEYGN